MLLSTSWHSKCTKLTRVSSCPKLAHASRLLCLRTHASAENLTSSKKKRKPTLKLSTFNVLAPIYNWSSDGTCEAQCKELYMPRNKEILEELLSHKSPVVCLQEYWCRNDDIRELYEDALGAAGYSIFVTPRTNQRGDGLMTAIQTDTYKLIDTHPILFNDCGDRVAQLTHIASKEDSTAQAIIVNTHLLFPYNFNSVLIQLRETFKILEFLDQYMTSTGLHESGGLPILLCGDWNGTGSSQVAEYLKSQGFISAYDDFHVTPGLESNVSASAQLDTLDDPGNSTDGSMDSSMDGSMDEYIEGCSVDPTPQWVSHRHRDGTALGVDFVWLLNPSMEGLLRMAADWRLAVYGMIMAKLLGEGVDSSQAGYEFFKSSSTENNTCDWPMAAVSSSSSSSSEQRGISRAAFRRAVDSLGLTGPDSIGLLKNEVDECYDSLKGEDESIISYDDFLTKLNMEEFVEACNKIQCYDGAREGEWEFDRLTIATATATANVNIPNTSVDQDTATTASADDSASSESDTDSDSNFLGSYSYVPYSLPGGGGGWEGSREIGDSHDGWYCSGALDTDGDDVSDLIMCEDEEQEEEEEEEEAVYMETRQPVGAGIASSTSSVPSDRSQSAGQKGSSVGEGTRVKKVKTFRRLKVKGAMLPDPMANGDWPSEYMSDHAPLQCWFTFR